MTQVAKIEDQQTALPADPMVSMIERVVMDPNSDITKLERMLEMKERHDAQNAKAAFARAFAAASAEFPTIPLNGEGHNGKPYATLEDITKLTRPVLSKHGLALTFSIDVADQVVVTAKLMHQEGHSESTSMALPRDTSGSKNAVQAVGSTQKYGQRYTAQAILGLSLGQDDEDDGAAAGGAETITPEQYIALRDKLEASGMNPVKFYTAFGHKDPTTADLQLFPARLFDDAMKRLDAYMAAKGAK